MSWNNARKYDEETGDMLYSGQEDCMFYDLEEESSWLDFLDRIFPDIFFL